MLTRKYNYLNIQFTDSFILIMVFCFFLISINPGEVYSQQSYQQDAIINDYYEYTIDTPPEKLNLDPFYKKYTDARGIPVITGGDVPDVALLVARDVILHMLSERPDLRNHMAREIPGWCNGCYGFDYGYTRTA